MDIRVDDLSGREIRELLQEHLANMRQILPPESTHALPIEGLRQPEITFCTAWENGEFKCRDTVRIDFISACSASSSFKKF